MSFCLGGFRIAYNANSFAVYVCIRVLSVMYTNNFSIRERETRILEIVRFYFQRRRRLYRESRFTYGRAFHDSKFCKVFIFLLSVDYREVA